MVSFKPLSAALGVLVVIFAATSGYLATNPVTVTTTTIQTNTTTQVTTITQVTTVTSTATTFTIVLVGSEEQPKPTGSTAMGIAVFTLSPDGNSMSWVLTVNNLVNITAAHIHFGPPTCVCPVVVPLFTGPAKIGPFTGILSQGTFNSSAFASTLKGQPMSTLLTIIRNGTAYVNVHSTLWPGGEIRGDF